MNQYDENPGYNVKSNIEETLSTILNTIFIQSCALIKPNLPLNVLPSVTLVGTIIFRQKTKDMLINMIKGDKPIKNLLICTFNILNKINLSAIN